jgi:hypothetical protein
MLRWPIAANEPSTIEAIATNTTICCHCGDDAGERRQRHAGEHRHAATFGAEAKNAVTGVGAPS